MKLMWYVSMVFTILGFILLVEFSDSLLQVRGILKMLQGFSSPLFKWDLDENCFCAKSGVYVAHLSRTSLHTILSQFRYAATCLQLVDILVNNVKRPSRSPPPTLKAFVTAVSSWVKVRSFT